MCASAGLSSTATPAVDAHTVTGIPDAAGSPPFTKQLTCVGQFVKLTHMCDGHPIYDR